MVLRADSKEPHPIKHRSVRHSEVDVQEKGSNLGPRKFDRKSLKN